MTDKTCTVNTRCQYRFLNATFGYSCKYLCYCDYQLPRDSRQWEHRLPLTEQEEKMLGICYDFLHTVTIAGENEPNIPHQQVIFKSDVPALVKAILDMGRGSGSFGRAADATVR